MKSRICYHLRTVFCEILKIRGEEMHNPVFSVSNFGAFDYSMGKHQPGEGPERIVSSYEFEFFTEKGVGGLRIDSTFYQASRGGCLLAKPGQTESVIKPYKGYYLNIVTQDPELCDMLDHLPNSFTLWNMGEVVKLIHKMINTEDKQSLVSRMKLQSDVCQILALLYKYRRTANSDVSTLQHQKNLLMVDKYIRDHLSEELTLASLAKLCNLDPSYFHKLYTAAFGRTPAQRILGFRIAAAKTALIENKISLGEIAARCGFSSQTYFCYKFKQVTDMTPMQYRSEMLSRPKA